MKKVVKGNFGYISAKRKQAIIRTILYFVIALAIFVIGYLVSHTKQNIGTIAAVLGCLPACKSLVSVIILIRATGCSDDAYQTIKEEEGHLIGMYDMYFTSYQKNFAISHMIVENKIILALTEDTKCDISACKEHLSTMLKQGGFKDMTITISQDVTAYCKQLSNLNEMNQEFDPTRDDEVRVTLYDISL